MCLCAVKQQILRFQSPTTGLFPADLSQPGNMEAHVRDSIYCAVAVWSLAQAYKCARYCLFADMGHILEIMNL